MWFIGASSEPATPVLSLSSLQSSLPYSARPVGSWSWQRWVRRQRLRGQGQAQGQCLSGSLGRVGLGLGLVLGVGSGFSVMNSELFDYANHTTATFFLCGFTSVRKITWVVHFVKAKAARSQDQGQRFLSARCLWGWQGAWGRLGLGLGLAKNCLAYIAARLSLHRSMVQLDHFVCVLMLAPTSVATVCCCLFALKSSSLPVLSW